MLPEALRLPLAILFLIICIVVVMTMFASVSEGAGIAILLTRLFPWTRSGLFREQREGRAQGFTPGPALDHLVGQVGVLDVDARPVGKARFLAEVVTVVSEAEMLKRGTRVVATSVRGGALVVRPEAATRRPGAGP